MPAISGNRPAVRGVDAAPPVGLLDRVAEVETVEHGVGPPLAGPQHEVGVAGAHVEQCLGLGEAGQGGHAAVVVAAQRGEADLGELLADALVGVGVVVVEPGRREGRVLEDVGAVGALVEVEGARLVLQQVGEVDLAGEGPRPAPRARVAPGLEPHVEIGDRRQRRGRPLGGPGLGGLVAGRHDLEVGGPRPRQAPQPGLGQLGRRQGGRLLLLVDRAQRQGRLGAPRRQRGQRSRRGHEHAGRHGQQVEGFERDDQGRHLAVGLGEGGERFELAPALIGRHRCRFGAGRDPQAVGQGRVPLGAHDETGHRAGFRGVVVGDAHPVGQSRVQGQGLVRPSGRPHGVLAQHRRIDPAQQPQPPLGGQVAGDEVEHLEAPQVHLLARRHPGGVVDGAPGDGHEVDLARLVGAVGTGEDLDALAPAPQRERFEHVGRGHAPQHAGGHPPGGSVT